MQRRARLLPAWAAWGESALPELDEADRAKPEPLPGIGPWLAERLLQAPRAGAAVSGLT
ncbi:MAG TPA: hypothetical protein VJN44_06635 [Roseateles sp.]|nr:hypothetical protein [Roseateles sp.]